METTGRVVPNTAEGFEMPWHNKLQRLEEHFTLDRIAGMVREEMQWLLSRTQQMRVEEYNRMDNLRSKSVPYRDRLKQVNRRKIAWCDKEETRLVEALRRLRVKPLSEWFGEVDYWAAKRNGMRWIIRFRLEEIIA